MASHKFIQRHIWSSATTIGFLGATTSAVWGEFAWAFEQRLQELGWFDGANVQIDYQWARGDSGAYARIAAEFVRREVDVIVTSGTPAVMAARRATRTIPIVFAAAGDPVATGIVASLARPGGNVTGSSNGQTNLAPARLDRLRRVVPGLKRLALIGNTGSRNVPLEMNRVTRRARRLGIQTTVVNIRRAAQIAPAIKRLRGKVDALYVCTDPLITTNQIALNTAAAASRLPTMHAFRDYVENGGLMSYGPDFRAMFARAAEMVDRILRGTSPAAIPVTLQTRPELIINQNTANALGVTVPKGMRRTAAIIR